MYSLVVIGICFKIQGKGPYKSRIINVEFVFVCTFVFSHLWFQYEKRLHDKLAHLNPVGKIKNH